MLIAPPVLLAPVSPVVVHRAYRAAPRFVAGGRRSVRLRASPGVGVVAPCGGVVAFSGRVAGRPPVVTIACAGGWARVTVAGVVSAPPAGGGIAAGARIGAALADSIGLSARRPGLGYVDPLPLLRTSGHPPVPVVPARSARRARRPPAPRAPAVRTLVVAPTLPGAATARAAGPDRLLGALGIGAFALVGLGLAAARLRGAPRPRWRLAVHRVSARR